jgi:desampylase
MGMSVCISRPLLATILADARLSPERERCGLLLGETGKICAMIPAENVASDSTCAFEIDPAVLVRAYRAARHGAKAVIGHYHFHPHGDVRPSLRDAAQSHADGSYWLIIGPSKHALWRAEVGGPIHGAFEPAELVLATA